MGCLVSLVGLGLLGFFGFTVPDGQEWLTYAGVVLIVAGFSYPEDKK